MRIRYLLLFVPLILTLESIAQRDPFFSGVDRFLKEHVRNGKVDYGKLQQDASLLDTLVSMIDTIDYVSRSAFYQKAFCINAYNILVIRGVLDHYPISSPMDVEGFFSEKQFTVARQQVTLDQLEFERLFEDHPDPRLHFALNCAASSCPTLFNEAFTDQEIEDQLNFSTKMVMDREDYVRVSHEDDKVYVSKIFEWYREMFEAEGRTLRDFINYNRFTTIPSDYEIVFMEYDWSLNDLGGN